MTHSGSPFEAAVREAWARADHRAAATLILSELGPHVVRVIHARFRKDELTAEVFARFAEDLWRGLPQFAFRCSVRAWVFTLARNAGSRYLKGDVRRARAEVALSEAPEVLALAAQVRTATVAGLDAERRDLIGRLRAELSEEDQLLLTLRLDRELSFAEIACVTLGDADAADAALQREAARLRKRLQLVTDRLRKRWEEESRAR